MHARVAWFDPNLGGRESGAPSGSEYRPNALFLGLHSGAFENADIEFGSVRFFFLTDDRSNVELNFWSPQDLTRFVFEGSTFIVMEGATAVGFARMYEPDRKR